VNTALVGFSRTLVSILLERLGAISYIIPGLLSFTAILSGDRTIHASQFSLLCYGESCSREKNRKGSHLPH
jgi:hypothetical protein